MNNSQNKKFHKICVLNAETHLVQFICQSGWYEFFHHKCKTTMSFMYIVNGGI